MIKLDIKKIMITFLLIFLTLSIVHIFRLNKNARTIDSYKTYVDELKKQKDSIITINLSHIKLLKRDINKLNVNNSLFIKQLDSLRSAKQKIKIVYKERYKEIENFQGSEIESFWKKKFD